MAKAADEAARAFRPAPRHELLERLRDDTDRLTHVFESLSDADWSELVVPERYLGPLPAMIIVEGLTHVFRPISLGIRLFGNMFADHLVLGIFTDLTKVIIPVAFYVLGAFVSVVQAFVFTVLSMVYIALAISHEH